MNNKFITVAIIVLVCASFVTGFYAQMFGASSQNKESGAYDLTLVVTNVSSPNSSMNSQDVFFVLENSQLVSSAVIKVPFGTLVRITVINHDAATDTPLVGDASDVTGLIGNELQVFNSISESSNNITSGNGATSYSYFPSSDISHTFTTNFGLNIPIIPHSTEVGYTYFNSSGTFSWACMCECGPFSMSTPGWMMGSLVVLQPNESAN